MLGASHAIEAVGRPRIGDAHGAQSVESSNLPYLVPFYGLASALLFALSNHFSHMGLERSDARTGTIVSIATSAVAYWLFAPLFLESWYWLTAAALLFAAVGIIRPCSRPCSRPQHQADGPDADEPLTAVTPIFGAIFAILILGEPCRRRSRSGTAAVVAGAMVAASEPQGAQADVAALGHRASARRVVDPCHGPHRHQVRPDGGRPALVRRPGRQHGVARRRRSFFVRGAGLCLVGGSGHLSVSRPASAMPCRCSFSTTPSPWATWWRSCRRLGNAGVHAALGRPLLAGREHHLAHDRHHRLDRARA